MNNEEILNRPARVLLPFSDEERLEDIISKAFGISIKQTDKILQDVYDSVQNELKGMDNDLKVAIKVAEILKGNGATVWDALIIKATTSIIVGQLIRDITRMFVEVAPNMVLAVIRGGHQNEGEN